MSNPNKIYGIGDTLMFHYDEGPHELIITDIFVGMDYDGCHHMFIEVHNQNIGSIEHIDYDILNILMKSGEMYLPKLAEVARRIRQREKHRVQS